MRTVVLISFASSDKLNSRFPAKRMQTFRLWKKKLVTKDDFLHHHKILGLSCLVSFLFRFSMIFDDMGFPSRPGLTIPTLALHWMLTASSFQFTIPFRRIRDGGRIWPQYRYHAFAFTTRAIFLVALYWYEEQHAVDPFYTANFVVFMAGMAAADLATWAVGKEYRSNSIRDLEGSPWGKFWFSTMQFNSNASFLFGLRSYSIPFAIIFVVQLTPFVGTLRRKGLFRSNFWGAMTYAAFIGCGFLTQVYQYHKWGGEKLHLFVRAVGLIAAFLRLNPFMPSFLWPMQNKYFIWTTMYFALIQPCRPSIQDLDVGKLRLLVGMLLLALTVSCSAKVKSGYYPSDVISAKKMLKVQ